MNKELGNITISLMVRPYKGHYIGMCLEAGLIFEGDSFDEVQKSLFSATKILIETVEEDISLIPSLKLGLPLRYRTLFYASIGMVHGLRFAWKMKQMGSMLLSVEAKNFNKVTPACVC